MGEDVTGDSPDVWLGKSHVEVGASFYSDTVGRIARQYDLKHVSELHDLAEELVEIGCVSQWHGDDTIGEARKRAHKRAIAIKEAAVKVQSLLDRISAEAFSFADETRWSTHILDEVFDLKNRGEFGTSIYCMPAELSYLEEVSQNAGEYRRLKARIGSLAALPIRNLRSGPAPNMPLRYGVKACRNFWVNVENREWQLFTLNDTSVRKENSIAGLKNPCEQFVANMLAACGLKFSLTSLRSAWIAIEGL